MSWFKCDSEIITNAKVGRACAITEAAGTVYLALLCLHAKYGTSGVIPQSHCEPDGLRIEACAFLGRISEKRIEDAIAACVKVGLLVRSSAGLVLAGFGEEHMPECSRCHQPNPEPSHGTCPTCRAKKAEIRRRRAAEANGDQRADDHPGEGRKGHAPSARATATVAKVLPDRMGQDRTGQDRKGREQSMDGRMDGGTRTGNQNGEGCTRGSTRDAGSIAADVLRAVAP